MKDPSEAERYHALLTGEVSPAERDALVKRIRENPEALDALVRESAFISDLREETRQAAIRRRHLEAVQEEMQEAARKRPSVFAAFIAMAAAIVLSSGLLIVMLDRLPEERTATFSARLERTLSESDDAKQIFRAGDEYVLAEGYSEFAFLDGTQLLLEGPAKVRFRGHSQIELLEGRGSVTTRKPGFAVATDTSVVTDLGTAFGVEIVEPGSTRVVVLEGKVNLAVPARGKAVDLVVGMEGQIKNSGAPVVSEARSLSEFRRNWAEAEHAPWISGRAFFGGALGPNALSHLRGEQRIWVTLENPAVTFEGSWRVLVANAQGEFWLDDTGPVPTEPLEVYRLITAPAKERTLNAVIRFPGEVVGVIVAHQQHQMLDGKLGIPSLSKNFNRRTEVPANAKTAVTSESWKTDRLVLKPDGSTLAVRLHTVGSHIDDLRVLVRKRGGG